MLRKCDVTATEMEDVLRNLDHRLSKVEQILPTLATKDDLKAFATKEDLKAVATKEDLKAFATKEELNGVRKEMKALFAEARTHASVLFEKTQADLEMIAGHLADISQRLPPRA
jgi:uncharacterized protein (DUF849 family)